MRSHWIHSICILTRKMFRSARAAQGRKRIDRLILFPKFVLQLQVNLGDDEPEIQARDQRSSHVQIAASISSPPPEAWVIQR
jgi:hypothetical protein